MRQIGKHEFAELVINNRQSFYRIAFSYMKNEHDALDIVSEATCRGLTHIRALRDPSFFKTWMTRIVINTALESLRKSSRQILMAEYPPMQYTAPDMEPEIAFDLYDALDALGAGDNTFIILRYFEEYSIREMASLLELPESTVKSKTYRCLEKMRLYMEGGAAT